MAQVLVTCPECGISGELTYSDQEFDAPQDDCKHHLSPATCPSLRGRHHFFLRLWGTSGEHDRIEIGSFAGTRPRAAGLRSAGGNNDLGSRRSAAPAAPRQLPGSPLTSWLMWSDEIVSSLRAEQARPDRWSGQYHPSRDGRGRHRQGQTIANEPRCRIERGRAVRHDAKG